MSARGADVHVVTIRKFGQGVATIHGHVVHRIDFEHDAQRPFVHGMHGREGGVTLDRGYGHVVHT